MLQTNQPQQNAGLIRNQVRTWKNAAGIEYDSRFQAVSLFTLSAKFKDGNSCKFHSWKQETRGRKNEIIDHKHAFNRLYNLATTCTCNRNRSRCIWCNHEFMNLYCNLTDRSIYALTYQHNKMKSDVRFLTSLKGHNYLTKINGDNFTQLAVEHAKLNFEFLKVFPK